MKKVYLCAMLAGVLLGGFGCQNTANSIENADKTMQTNTIADRRFVTDGWLRDRLKLTGLNTSTTADALLRVQLTAVNVRTGFFDQMWSGMTGENPYKIKYRFTWFDKGGMAVESILSTWQEMTVIPGETVQIQSVAPTPECKDFSITLIEAE